MQRREFSISAVTATASAVAISLGFSGAALAQAKAPQDGTDYLTLDKAAPTEAPAGKIEVVEFVRDLLRASDFVVAERETIARATTAWEAGKGDFAEYLFREQSLAAGASAFATFDETRANAAWFARRPEMAVSRAWLRPITNCPSQFAPRVNSFALSKNVQQILNHRVRGRDDLGVRRVGLLCYDQLRELFSDIGIRPL